MQEALLAAKDFNVAIDQKEIVAHEIQSVDPREVARHKALEAYRLLGKPLVVTDTFWRIPALNGFPGAYMKDMVAWFSEDDFLALMQGKKDRTVEFSENIAYYDGIEYHFFSKTFQGVVTQSPRGDGNSMENIMEFSGVTLGEHRSRGTVSHEAKDYVWHDFFRWFTQH